MQVILKMDPERLTLDDLIAVEDAGAMGPRQLRDLLARFVVGEDGAFMDVDAARRQVGQMTLSELREAIVRFGEAIKTLQDRAVPPESGAGL